MRTGCEHNIERAIIYSRHSKLVENGEAECEDGDVLTLRCPRGCDDIYIAIQHSVKRPKSAINN